MLCGSFIDLGVSMLDIVIGQCKWLNKNPINNRKNGQAIASVQRGDLEKAWGTIVQDHYKKLQESLAAWKQNINQWCVTQDFCTIL